MDIDHPVIEWLLNSDEPALVYQVSRDLLGMDSASLGPLQERIGTEGAGRALLAARHADGHWGNGAYNPKWTCTHYALFELAQLGLPGTNAACRESADELLRFPRGMDGGVNYARTVEYSDVCINGMLLAIGSGFGSEESSLRQIVDFLLDTRMADGAWNCEYYHGARHGSLHTTISVLEGITAYLRAGYRYEAGRLLAAKRGGAAFILKHELYKRSTTGETIKDDFFKFAFPVRWKYDALRCLDWFRDDGASFHSGMAAALGALAKARRRDGTWKGSFQPGKEYLRHDRDRWVTLKALRVLETYGDPSGSRTRGIGDGR